MRGFHFLVRGTPVVDVLVVQQPQPFDRHLVNLMGQAADAAARRELMKAALAMFFAREFDENAFHAGFLTRHLQVYGESELLA
jgi:hypothetical protein